MANKILLVSPKWGKSVGGIENWAYNIERNLDDSGCVINVVNRSDGHLIKSLVAANLKSLTSDVIILMTWRMIVFTFLGLFAGKKILILCHGDEFLSVGGVWKCLLYILIRFSRVRYVANSYAIAKLIEETYPIYVSRVVNPFVDLEPLLKVGLSKTGNKFGEKINALVLTRLVPRKNVISVLKAVKTLRDSNGTLLRVTVAGTGPELRALQKYVKKEKLNGLIDFRGAVSDDEKIELFANSDVFILPSLLNELEGSIEGYGIVYIEANAAGLPVIAGCTGGTAEAVVEGVTGFLCDGSVAGVVGALKKLKNSEINLHKLLKHAQKHHYANHNFEQILKDLWK